MDAYEKQFLSKEYKINCITHSAKHGIYLGSSTALLFLNQNKIRKIDIGEERNITALLEYNDDLYIGTENGDLLTVNLYSFQLTTIGKIDYAIHKIFFEPKEKILLLGTMGRGLAKLSEQKIGFIQNENFSIVYDIINHENQTLLATEDGLYFYDSKRLILHKYNEQLSDKVITNLYKHDGNLYLCSQLGYLFLQKQVGFKTVLSPSEFSLSNQINEVAFFDEKFFIAKSSGVHTYNRQFEKLEDSVTNQLTTGLLVAENTCWVIGHSFIYKLKHLSNRTIRPKGVGDIQQLHSGRLTNYVASHGRILSTTSFTDYNFIKDFGDDISSMYESPNDALWVGTINKGTYVRKKGAANFEKVLLSGSLASNVVISIGGNGRAVWITTLDGIYMSKNSDDFKSIKQPTTNKIIYAYHLFQTKDKQFVISTDRDGVLILDSNFRLAKNALLNNKSIYTSLADGSGALWFLTADDGLYRLKENKLIQLNEANGLNTSANNAMLLIDDTTLAVVSAQGVSLVHANKLWVDNIGFKKESTIGINTISFCDNKLFIAGNDGIISLPLNNYLRYSVPNAHVEKVMMRDKIASPNSIFSADENSLSIWVDVITNQERPIYSRYKLNGFSNQWRSTGDNQITFPKLPPGNYQFIFQASFNKSFRHSSSTTFRFKIASPVWQRWWFISVCSVLLILLLFGLQKIREKRIKQIADLQKEKAVAEYENLKNQVNPHFLFNNFNTLISLIYDNQEKAIEYTEKLSTFYRSLIEDEKQLIPLSKEIALLQNYFYLQSIRMGEAIQLQIDISEAEANQLLIPSLTLQILCENAIKHNSASENNPLHIFLQKDNQYLYFKNNLKPKLNKQLGLGMGLSNIKNRYKLISRQDVVILSNEVEFFIVKLPLIKL